jgi:hypothetical protein
MPTRCSRKRFQNIGFRNGFQAFKLQIADNRQFATSKITLTPPRTPFFGQNARFGFIEKIERQKFAANRVRAALIKNIARTGFNVIKQGLRRADGDCPECQPIRLVAVISVVTVSGRIFRIFICFRREIGIASSQNQ